MLVILAHPDDENGIGGTLARYAAEGVRVVLVCATRGEAGTIFNTDLATPETIAQVREQELRCSCATLGIEPPRFLDCGDGAVRKCTDAALERLVRMMRLLRPQIVITFGPDGIYGHPDHVAVSRLATQAWEMAGDSSAFPQHEDAGLTAYTPSRLFYFALPASLIAGWSRYANLTVELNGETLPIRGVPDEEITLALDVTPYLEQKLTAAACHRTQVNPDSPMNAIPQAQRMELARTEYFVLAGGDPMPRRTRDLFAEPPDESEVAPPSKRYTVEMVSEDNSQRLGRPSLARDITALKRNMTFRFAYMRLYQASARGLVERDAQPLMREFVEEEREILSRLSNALRQLRQPAPVEQPDDSLARKMSARRGTINRLKFIRQGLVTALDWYYRHAEDQGHHPDIRTIFKELGDLQLQRVRRMDDLVKRLKREKDERSGIDRSAGKPGSDETDDDDVAEVEEPGE
jgi:LmbE family N-acetylglucosaminyl deacetylase